MTDRSERKFILPQDIPLDVYPKPEVFLNEARRLTAEAQKRGLLLRVMGALAFRNYFPDFSVLYDKVERLGERVFTDIDYAAYGAQRGKLVQFFNEMGYDIDKDTLMYYGTSRHIYFSDEYADHVPMIDVFYDRLDMNHCINYKGRLELDAFSVPVTDLLLQKLQIVKINDKDLKDAIILLLAAPLAESDEHAINTRYLAKMMAGDWGFYHTSTTNLKHIQAYLSNVPALSLEQCRIVSDKVDVLLNLLADEPKTLRWKMRAKQGTKKLWYNEVSDWD